MTVLAEGQKAPAFTLKDASGKPHSLADALARGPVILAFFKITCPVCQFTFPFLERLYKSADSAKSTVWAVSQDDAHDTIDFCDEYGVTFPALVDESGYPVSNAYGITNVPSVFLISSAGNIAITSVGFSKKELEQMAAEAAAASAKPPQPLFRAGEVVPDYKPG